MTVAYLLILAVLAVLTVRAARRRRIPLLLLYALLILSCVMLLYFSVYYRAGEEAQHALPDRDVIPIGFGTSARFFDGPGEDTALIFYPGAKVEAAAYAPLLYKIAAGGTDCYLVEMPLHFAFFGVNAADPIIETKRYAHWVLAGHSLGGVAASNYAHTHTDTVAGLVLLASYPADETGPGRCSQSGKLRKKPRLLAGGGRRTGDPRRKPRAVRRLRTSARRRGSVDHTGRTADTDGAGNPALDSDANFGKGKGRVKRWMETLLTALLLLLLCGCARETARADAAEATPFPAAQGLRVAVGSDLHLDPDNRVNGAALSAAGYNLELVDALLWDAHRQGAKLILLTGDFLFTFLQ